MKYYQQIQKIEFPIKEIHKVKEKEEEGRSTGIKLSIRVLYLYPVCRSIEQSIVGDLTLDSLQSLPVLYTARMLFVLIISYSSCYRYGTSTL